MAEFFAEYFLFFAKLITFAIVAILVIVSASSGRRKDKNNLELSITHLNRKYDSMKESMAASVLSKRELKLFQKEQKKIEKQRDKAEGDPTAQAFVLNFDGDIKASEVTALRDEITSVLSIAKPGDEVVLRLENAGGIVHEHGLAASQLKRLTSADLNLTAVIDRIAASGGYMMACVANKIVAAPFAVVGSIGVVAQLPNFSKLLDKHGVDVEQHTAGEYKRTVTMFGKNTQQDRVKLKEQLEDTHTLFKDYILENRPSLDLEKVATGEHWYAIQAKELGLVDELSTSDDYLLKLSETTDVYEVEVEVPKTIQEKLLGGLAQATQTLSSFLGRDAPTSADIGVRVTPPA